LSGSNGQAADLDEKVEGKYMTKIITIANKKGGVGKTSTCVSVAHGLALEGKTVLIVDTDPQGHVASALGLEQEPGLFNLLVSGRWLREVIRHARPNLWVLPGNQRTATAEAMLVYEKAKYDVLGKAISGKINGRLDYILVDTAPSGVGFLQESALWAAHLVLIPSACDYLSGAGIVDLATRLSEFKADGWQGRILGILPTFYDQVTKESAANRAELEAAFGDLVLDPIHRATVLRECTAEGKTVFELAPKSRAAEEYAAVVWRVLDAT
jgi:chromosome partitioning protein